MNSFIQELLKFGVSTEHVEKILAIGQLEKIKSQAQLVDAGQRCDKAYFVLSGGFVCRYINDEFGVEKTINFYLPQFHPFMSCIDSFFTGTPTQCELRAIAHSEVMGFRRKDIDVLITQHPELFKAYHALVTDALQGENDLKMKIISYPSVSLYDYLITHCPSIIQHVPSKYIAEFMGITQEWLSKLKKSEREKSINK